MNAATIIDEIKLLPRGEKGQIVEFVQTLKEKRPWSGAKLTEYERRMVETNDPAEAERLKQQIVAAFYAGGVLASSRCVSEERAQPPDNDPRPRSAPEAAPALAACV